MVEYARTLRFEDFNTLPGFDADVVVTTGEWNRLGTMVIPAGIMYAIGRKFDGYAVALLKGTDTTAFHGIVRITATDPQEFRKIVLLEFNTRTTTDMGDKAKKRLLPLITPWVRKDSKLILEIWPEETIVMDYGETLSAIDVTVRVV